MMHNRSHVRAEVGYTVYHVTACGGGPGRWWHHTIATPQYMPVPLGAAGTKPRAQAALPSHAGEGSDLSAHIPTYTRHSACCLYSAQQFGGFWFVRPAKDMLVVGRPKCSRRGKGEVGRRGGSCVHSQTAALAMPSEQLIQGHPSLEDKHFPPTRRLTPDGSSTGEAHARGQRGTGRVPNKRQASSHTRPGRESYS